MAGGNRHSRLPAWRVTTVITDREVHYPCDFKTCQSLGIDPVRVCGWLTEGRIKECQKMWLVDDGWPHSSEYVKIYRQLSSGHCKWSSYCLSAAVRRLKESERGNKYLEMTIPVKYHHQKFEVKLQEDDPYFEYNSWRRSLTVFPLARRETASSANDTWISSVLH